MSEWLGTDRSTRTFTRPVRIEPLCRRRGHHAGGPDDGVGIEPPVLEFDAVPPFLGLALIPSTTVIDHALEIEPRRRRIRKPLRSAERRLAASFSMSPEQRERAFLWLRNKFQKEWPE
jgi:hypothetical protein